MRKEVEQLIKQAERDLLNAEKNIEISAYEVSAFLTQQGVEKYLRAVYLHLKGRFGSRARGDALKHSDLDLIIVSKAFEGINFLKRIAMVISDLDVPFGIDLLDRKGDSVSLTNPPFKVA